MLNAILTRWARTRGALLFLSTSAPASTLPPAAQARSGSFPPPRNAGGANEAGWQGASHATPAQHKLKNNLTAARAQFQAALQGLAGDSVEDLERSIRRCRSLLDLWHLRTWIYTEVARCFSQHEAERRVQGLNAFFCSNPAMAFNALPLRSKKH